MNQTTTVEHGKPVDGKLYHSEDGNLWLVQAGRSERVVFVLGDGDGYGDGDNRLTERSGQPMCEVGVDNTQSLEMMPTSSSPFSTKRAEDGGNIETLELGANAVDGDATSTMSPSGRHFKVSTNKRYYTNLGPHFVEAGMYSIHTNGSTNRLKQTTLVKIGDTLHMIDNKTNSYWRGVVETGFDLATKEGSFFGKSEIEECRIKRHTKDWDPLDGGEMLMSVRWTTENLTKELKKVINKGWNAVTIKPIDTTAIEEVLAKF